MKTSLQKPVKKFFLLMLCISYSLHLPAQWRYLGLGITYATDLIIYNDTIYASTYDGIYKKHVYSTDTNWIACGMQGEHVVQTLIPDYQEFISVVEIDSTYTTHIYRSTNGGLSFNLLHPGISGPNGYQYLDAVAHPDNNFDTLYFLNHRLKTYDKGMTWDTIPTFFQSDRFIKVNTANHDQVILGGETFGLSAYLQISNDNGATWSMPMMSGYFGGDNSVHDMVIDGNEWYAAGEGVICKSTDGGDTWVQLLNYWGGPLAFSLYNYDLEFSPADKNRIYLTGSNFNAVRVPLLYTSDKGITWDTASFAPFDVSNPEMKCLEVRNTTTGDFVFLGGHGVYRFENNFTSLHETENDNEIIIYPNPASDLIHIKNTTGHHCTFSLCNLTGKQIISGINLTSIKMNQLPPGVYVLKARNEMEEKVFKIIKL